MSIKRYQLLTVLTLFVVLSLYNTSCTVRGNDYAHTERDIRGLVCFSEILYSGVSFQQEAGILQDQDFLELRNYSDSVIDISGWVIEVRGDQYCVITLPPYSVLAPGQVYTVVNTPNGAFLSYDLVIPGLHLSPRGFCLSLRNGSDSMIADYVDFREGSGLPVGMSTGTVSSSMVRTSDYFGARSSSAPGAWVDYYPIHAVNIDSSYSVFASPGSDSGPRDCLSGDHYE